MTITALPATIAGVEVIQRETFLDEYWNYQAGQHVTLLGKTQSGKTTLAYELLGRCAEPSMPALVLVMKPKDLTVERWAARLNMPRVRDWPLMPNPWRKKTNGYTIWPDLGDDPEDDEQILYEVFRRVVLDSYRSGKRRGYRRILFADEIVGVAELADEEAPAGRRKSLRRPIDSIWARGSGMGLGLWAATQRPAGMSGHGYSAPEHMFIAHEADDRTRKRYDEIGGADAGLVRQVTAKLPPHYFLYLQRGTGTYCVVSP